MTPELIKSLTGYKRFTIVCEKCGCKIIIETDYLTESQAMKQHKCKGKVKK